MGQIANQMAFETFYKVKEKIKETRAEKKHGMSIEEQFNLIADEYDVNRKRFIPCFDDYYITSTKMILANTETPHRVLDLGAGTGLLSYYWYRECDTANYVLVDIAEDMLEVSRKRFHGIENVSHEIMDYTKQLPKSGLIYLCFASDFLLEDADQWRDECWDIIRERSDCTFLFLTKRIERFVQCIPEDWGDGSDHVVVCCTVENQENADRKLSVFQKLPIKHKQITAQPLLERINMEKYLAGIEAVVVGGESDRNARVLDYDWVLDIREQCIRQNVSFQFRQCGTHFIKDGKEYTLQVKDLCSQARRAGIDYDRRLLMDTGSKE